MNFSSSVSAHLDLLVIRLEHLPVVAELDLLEFPLNPILHWLFQHPILHGGRGHICAPYLSQKPDALEQ